MSGLLNVIPMSLCAAARWTVTSHTPSHRNRPFTQHFLVLFLDISGAQFVGCENPCRLPNPAPHILSPHPPLMSWSQSRDPSRAVAPAVSRVASESSSADAQDCSCSELNLDQASSKSCQVRPKGFCYTQINRNVPLLNPRVESLYTLGYTLA